MRAQPAKLRWRWYCFFYQRQKSDKRVRLPAGAILADDMGLGKTLQSIAVLFTLLRQGFEKNKPVVNRAVVCCPTRLVFDSRMFVHNHVM